MGRGLLALLADSGPVVVLAVIAAAGSFTHIRDTATEHGQHGWMAWAIAVCIDLTCVMAARERQRDARTGRETGPLSWPTSVLVGGILLSLAANLAQAEPTAWGWITAATPAGAFLVAVSMLERRAATRPEADGVESGSSSVERLDPPPSWGRPDTDTSSPAVPLPSAAVPALDQPQDEPAPEQDEQPSGPAPELLAYARQVADEHHTQHGRPITRDTLRARLGVSNQLASDLLHRIRT
ncbi:DUF2637 domain-containing protein [Actinocorallia sp. B10E7]|uniref:DUF2637 domain-containing protein n=1 Tax=Actinocorallia sp. B10E7 TaxID=3153558 RepID=UPI00325CDC0C